MPLRLTRALLLLALLPGSDRPAMAETVSNQPSPEHVVWDRSPIPVVLPVGRERRIDFPVAVKLVVPKGAVSASKPIQIREDGSVYWTATRKFATQRVQAITFTGYSYLLDVSAEKGGASHPLVIIDERVPAEADGEAGGEGELAYDYDIVDLTRYAAQSVYAPSRLVRAMPGVTRIPVSAGACSPRLYRFRDLSFEPLASWQSPGIPTRYVTAVRVISRSSSETVFDPRRLRGEWLAATAQHSVLEPAGADGDHTTWYLVSARPFEESCP